MGRTCFGEKDAFNLGNKEFKELVRHLRVYELTRQTQC